MECTALMDVTAAIAVATLGRAAKVAELPPSSEGGIFLLRRKRLPGALEGKGFRESVPLARRLHSQVAEALR